MKNKLLIAVFLCFLIIMLPVSFANEINYEEDANNLRKESVVSQTESTNFYLPVALAALLVTLGISAKTIIVGAAISTGGYIIYHVTEKLWIWYAAYQYTTLTKHAYDNINDFPNIWKKTPSKKDFEKKCRDVMNSKSSKVDKYIQKSDGRKIAYDSKLEMVTVGETDGKTIVTCFRDKGRRYVDRRIKNKEWSKIKEK